MGGANRHGFRKIMPEIALRNHKITKFFCADAQSTQTHPKFYIGGWRELQTCFALCSSTGICEFLGIFLGIVGKINGTKVRVTIREPAQNVFWIPLITFSPPRQKACLEPWGRHIPLDHPGFPALRSQRGRPHRRLCPAGHTCGFLHRIWG